MSVASSVVITVPIGESSEKFSSLIAASAGLSLIGEIVTSTSAASVLMLLREPYLASH